jgi:serine phosphatase RsbU (regulator of sigma subunit)
MIPIPENNGDLGASLARELALQSRNSAALLLVQVSPLEPGMSCEELLDFFLKRNHQVNSLPVVQDGKPLGIVTRSEVVDRFSRLYFRELYGRKSISEIMNASALVVDKSVTLEELGRLVSREGRHVLTEGFIITEEGKYLGMGNGQALVRELTERKEAELQSALDRASVKLLKAQEELIEKHRLQKELSIAHDIQAAMLPKGTPDVPGYSVAAYYRSAEEVGGDYYDFIPLAGGLWGLAVADVAGKGVPGSLGMALARTVLRTQAASGRGPAETLRRTNAILTPDLRHGMFITLFFAVFHPERHLLRCACGGHNPAFHLGGAHGVRTVSPEGMALGLGPSAAYYATEDDVALAPGDVFVLYTDGVIEAMNPYEEEYGEHRFLSSLVRHGSGPFDRLAESLIKDLSAFTETAPQTDDITLVLLRRNA